jgi:hypothetical protein
MPPPRLVGRLRTPPAISAGAPLGGRSGTDSSGKVRFRLNSFSPTCVAAVRPGPTPFSSCTAAAGASQSRWCKISGPQHGPIELWASSPAGLSIS